MVVHQTAKFACVRGGAELPLVSGAQTVDHRARHFDPVRLFLVRSGSATPRANREQHAAQQEEMEQGFAAEAFQSIIHCSKPCQVCYWGKEIFKKQDLHDWN